ncbi:hypothetical protein [Rhodococcus aetherivorans]|uniref:hypothetical protein n=1 Tax=Rhodococcus aetherivorans TaxID=191292 RepID=UPI00045CB4EC|nr:hypothetical protein [Rhodococcus aetherivorans]KDE13226.1 hypothetical protein N505_0111585 [Rhodococcus aetherivorans]
MDWQQRWAVEGVQTGILIVRSLVAEALDEVPAGVALRDVALPEDLRCRYEQARLLLARAVTEARAIGVVVPPGRRTRPGQAFSGVAAV